VKEACSKANVREIHLHSASRMTRLVRFYYGQGFYIRSVSEERGYLRALFIYEM
jgi:hypothetical protein